jgi:hypothetical protein
MAERSGLLEDPHKVHQHSEAHTERSRYNLLLRPVWRNRVSCFEKIVSAERPGVDRPNHWRAQISDAQFEMAFSDKSWPILRVRAGASKGSQSHIAQIQMRYVYMGIVACIHQTWIAHISIKLATAFANISLRASSGSGLV